MLAVVTESESMPAASDPTAAAVTGGSLIDEIVREGARRMLAAALEPAARPTAAPPASGRRRAGR
jgi:hypothetical protein